MKVFLISLRNVREAILFFFSCSRGERERFSLMARPIVAAHHCETMAESLKDWKMSLNCGQVPWKCYTISARCLKKRAEDFR